MTDPTIHNFRYFLEELEKNLRSMESLAEKESIALRSIYILHDVMSKMCENLINQQKSEQ